MSSLFEIAEDALALSDLVDELDGDITGQEEAVAAFFAEGEDAIAKKVEGYCQLIDDATAKAKARKEQSARIAALAKTDENKAKFLKARLKEAFELLQITKLETATHKLSIAKNGGKLSVIVDDESAVLEQYGSCVVILDGEAKDNLRADLADGVEVKGARFGERGTSLRIK